MTTNDRTLAGELRDDTLLFEVLRGIADDIQEAYRYQGGQSYAQRIRIALTAALPGGGWRDIATAPKDGTEILVSGLSHGKRYGDLIAWKDGEWCTFAPDDDAYTWPVKEPTHWMPFPDTGSLCK